MKKIFFILAFLSAFLISSAQVGRNYNTYNVKDYGFVDDSVTDNTPAFRALVALVPDGARIYFPGGGPGYVFFDSINIKKNIIIYGDGYAFYGQQGVNPTPNHGATNLYFKSATKNFLRIDTSVTNQEPVFLIEKLSIINNSNTQPTAGSGIVLDHQCFNQVFRDMEIRGFYVDLNILSAVYVTVDNCRMAYPVTYGIVLNNYITPDGGGFNIINTKIISGFSTPAPTAGIYFKGGGAVHIINDDINAGSLVQAQDFSYGILMDCSSGPTSDIMISDILCENFQVEAIKINNLSGGRLADIQISKIEFLPFNNTGTVQNGIEVDSCWRVTVDDIVGYNNSNVPYAMVKLVKDTGVVLGARLIWSDPNNPGSNGWATSDSIVNCLVPVRAVSTARAWTGLATSRVVVKEAGPGGGANGDSVLRTVPVTNFYPTFFGFSNTVSYGQGSTASGNTITNGAADTVNPGMVTTAGQYFKGQKLFVQDVTINGWPIGNGDNIGGFAGLRIGTNALNTSYTGANNIAIGTGSQHTATTAASIVSVGNSSFVSNLTGARGVGVGTSSCNTCKGNDLTAVGDQAMVGGAAGVTGPGNTALGATSLNAVTSGQYNVGLGYGTLFKTTTPANNLAAGTDAGFNNVTGQKNTFLGTLAGFSETSDGNVLIGEEAGYYETAANKFDIANSPTAHLISGDFSTGQVCINCTTTGSSTVSLTSGATLEVRGGNTYLNGAVVHKITSISATGSYSATGTDYTIIFTGSTATLVYPTVGLVSGRHLNIVNQASGTVTIPTTTTGNAVTITSLTTGQNAQVEYDGTIWRKVN